MIDVVVADARTLHDTIMSGQIAMLTVRINHETRHVRTARKDNPSKRALLRFVEARKRHLRYLKRESEERYNSATPPPQTNVVSATTPVLSSAVSSP